MGYGTRDLMVKFLPKGSGGNPNEVGQYGDCVAGTIQLARRVPAADCACSLPPSLKLDCFHGSHVCLVTFLPEPFDGLGELMAQLRVSLEKIEAARALIATGGTPGPSELETLAMALGDVLRETR